MRCLQNDKADKRTDSITSHLNFRAVFSISVFFAKLCRQTLEKLVTLYL